MSKKKTIILLTAVALVSLIVVFAVIAFGDSKPLMLGGTADPDDTVDLFFSSLCEGDSETCDRLLYGYSSLGFDGDADSEVGAALLDAVRKSYSYKIISPAAVDGIDAAATVSFTRLDASLLVQPVKDLAGELMTKRVHSASSDGDIYAEDGSYREDVVMEVLSEAVGQVLSSPEQYYVTDELEIRLAYSGHEWKIILTNELAEAITGGLA